MKRRIRFAVLARATPVVLALACSSENSTPDGPDTNRDNVADDLGRVIDKDGDGFADAIDINNDGLDDGPGIDTDNDGEVDALALDRDCDGFYEAMDTTGDGLADFVTTRLANTEPDPDCKYGLAAAGGSEPSGLGNASYQGTGSSSDRYAEGDVYRNGVGYKFIANGWGSGWQSHQISWNGTSFNVISLQGTQGQNYSPAGYPTVFCGNYSMKQSVGACGLPAAISSLSSVKTGWRWRANGNTGEYNAAWDIWIGNGTSLSSYLMVWLRDPPGQQPAGSAMTAGASIQGLPGTWSIWTGNVEGRPIVNYVRAEGNDLAELEFDVVALYQDAIARNLALPGTHIMAVAIGFEIWNGPVSNLQTEDFYVEVN